ncbi:MULTISPECIES: DsbA family protein [Deinococcus]|nr:DsbA family protein [Deinococcus radiodurans]ANC72029.1 disulfide bond formation protein DsbA [Deinococcus radiodurans R1 = ATCC 13939 = DSM 20539]QIP28891.1 DsbA family protein [Deinococcus radiodurans]QIP32402.1 DsbA family protein [Deinococcus radiodurans]UID69751.1 disulfide bond formation protein DsbA [Deinococcus radiodurans R1 = ATCC 13939 = DSM 20539]UTA50317.1 DsbA family protein [Deinococcus radiodurans]
MTRLSGNNQNRSVLIIGTLVAAALIALALFAVRGKSTTTTGEAQTFTYANLPYAGQANAPVNVLVVEDFKCPNCKSFEETVAPELRTKYVGTGKVKMYSLVYPFLADRLPEDDSKYAAQAARCVYAQGKNDAFNTYKEILFRAQGPETEVWATKSRLKELATSLDIDQAKFATCLDNDETAAQVETDKQEALKAGVGGTPTVFVNGKLVNVQSDYVKDISAAIDEALKP